MHILVVAFIPAGVTESCDAGWCDQIAAHA